MFNWEAHGGVYTAVAEGDDWRTGKGPLPLVPALQERAAVMYLNRFAEVAWMTLRTLPILQCESGSFKSDWATRWDVLDDSFRFQIEAFAKEGKPLFSAIIEFIRQKFRFRPETARYPEPAKS